MAGGRHRAVGAAAVLALAVAAALTATLTATLTAAVVAAQPAPVANGPRSKVVVGSKYFAESRLLGEIFAQLIEARTDLEVERRLGLAGTEFCFEALRTGAIDVYPEYTGTGWVSLLHESPAPSGSGANPLRELRRRFLDSWDLWWLAPLGFENSFELAVPRELAEREHLRTISDLVQVAPRLRAAFGHEFVEREDGFPGLAATYGLRFASIQAMVHAPKFQAAGERIVDVLDVYTTDSQLVIYDLVVLEDDHGFFPPYEAAPLARGETLKRHPELGTVLGLLAGAIDANLMRSWNLRLQQDLLPVETVAADALAELGLVGDPGSRSQATERTRAPIPSWVWSQRGYLGRLIAQHLVLAGIALLLGVAVALPLALVLVSFAGSWAETAIRAIGTSQTIPSLALLGFLIPLLGVGALPAVVALWIYSIFPILRNAYSGIRDADPQAVEAATALGMTPGQVLRQVRLPLAAPTIMAGIRTAAILSIGTATLAAFIGGGGLGEPIISGVQLVDSRRILLGAIPAALLALIVDWLLGWLEGRLRPSGVGSSIETRS